LTCQSRIISIATHKILKNMKKTIACEVIKYPKTGEESHRDSIIVEEPLEIKVISAGSSYDLSVTMRTPGDDFNLATGFLFTEGIIHSTNDIAKISFDTNPQIEYEDLKSQSISVHLHKNVDFDPTSLQRHFYASSSCGVCGKSSVDMVKQQGLYLINKQSPKIESDILYSLASLLHDKQSLFSATGGNHAAALFDSSGQISFVSEDVGRHNAMDKLIGKCVKDNLLPLRIYGVLVSGRAGFELIQKAWMAGIGLFVAIGAPSSLAVQLADEVGMTLVGFLGEDRFNVYTHSERVEY